MDNNGTLDLEEFVTFLRPIFPQKFSRDYLSHQFYKEILKETGQPPTPESTITIL